METPKSPTIHDVAKRAGVSLSTVSRVINDYAFINPQTREKVEAALKDLGYEKTRPETAKPVREMDTVGLIVPDLSNPFFPLLMKGVENVVKTQGYSLVFCDSENNADLEQQHIETLFQRGVDGVILIPSAETTHVETLTKNAIPFVFLDRFVEIEDANAVVCDNEEGAYQVVKYLVKLGHQQILLITGDRSLSTEQARFRGYQQALAEEGLAYMEDLCLLGNYRLDEAYQATVEALRKHIEFTAVFATNDMMAFGVKQALEDQGRQIPEDVSLVGYDDIFFAAMIDLTTVAQPAYEMGKNAMFRLLDLMHERIVTPQRIVLRPSMVIRKSCKRR